MWSCAARVAKQIAGRMQVLKTCWVQVNARLHLLAQDRVALDRQRMQDHAARVAKHIALTEAVSKLTSMHTDCSGECEAASA